MSRSSNILRSSTIITSTIEYQAYLEHNLKGNIVREHLAHKYDLMALKKQPFPFFRGTCYRFLQLFRKICKSLFKDNPEILAIIDWHCENIGTWHDFWARLVLGCNDFDEAAMFIWVIDLVRQAVSIKLAADAGHLRMDFERACAVCLANYEKCLRSGGRPISLEEEGHRQLRKMFQAKLKEPAEFFAKLKAARSPLDHDVPPGALAILNEKIPPHEGNEDELHLAGVGSLGRLRVERDGIIEGTRGVYEVKATVPSCAYFEKGLAGGPIMYMDIVSRAVRAADPFLVVTDEWTGRRQSASCSKVRLEELRKWRYEEKLIEAIGWETGNIHLGTPDEVPAILRRIPKMDPTWLRDAGIALYDETLIDQKVWANYWTPKVRRRFLETGLLIAP